MYGSSSSSSSSSGSSSGSTRQAAVILMVVGDSTGTGSSYLSQCWACYIDGVTSSSSDSRSAIHRTWWHVTHLPPTQSDPPAELSNSTPLSAAATAAAAAAAAAEAVAAVAAQKVARARSCHLSHYHRAHMSMSADNKA